MPAVLHESVGISIASDYSTIPMTIHAALFSPSFLWKEVPRRGGGWPRETVLPRSGKPTPPRFARLPLPKEGARMIFKEPLIKLLSFAVRDSRFFPPHMPRTSPLSSSVFHAAGALSAPSGHLPLEGKAIPIKRRSRHLHSSFLIRAKFSFRISGRSRPTG